MKDKKTETPEEKDINEANAHATAEVKEEAQPLTDAEKLKEVTDKYTRLYAEYDNFRRRTAKEKIDLIKFGGEETILSFLAVADDLERALAHHKEGEAKEGLELIYQKMVKILSAKNVVAFGAKGDAFDADIHEAITSMPSEELKGKIFDVVEKGYKLNDKVIRHAKVVVGS
jgi:molecular chaperone GrpE